MDNAKQLKVMVRGAYDLQKLRIQMGNRIVGNFKAKLGQEPSEKESEMDAEGKALLVDLRHRFKKITDGIVGLPKQKDFVGDEVISTYAELCLMSQYLSIEKSEKEHFKQLGAVLTEFPIYTEWLRNIRGIGNAMAAVIIAEIDIAKDRYPSSLWAYAGLDVAPNGAGRSRKKEHLVVRQYKDKDGKDAERNSITFNPFLKTKLIGVLGPSFLRADAQADTPSPYVQAYREYKHRLENHEAHKEKSKGHRNNMAIRYMIKRFLADLYNAWRRIEGLPVEPDYHQKKLQHVHVA